MSVIPYSLYKSLPGVTLRTSTRRLSGPGHKRLSVKGQFTPRLQYGDQEVQEEVFVVKGLSQALLGHPAIKSLCLVCRLNTVQTSKDVWHKGTWKT